MFGTLRVFQLEAEIDDGVWYFLCCDLFIYKEYPKSSFPEHSWNQTAADSSSVHCPKPASPACISICVPKNLLLLAVSQGHISLLPGCFCLAFYFASDLLLSPCLSICVVSVRSECPITPRTIFGENLFPESLEFPHVYRVLLQPTGFWSKGRIFFY